MRSKQLYNHAITEVDFIMDYFVETVCKRCQTLNAFPRLVPEFCLS